MPTSRYRRPPNMRRRDGAAPPALRHPAENDLAPTTPARDTKHAGLSSQPIRSGMAGLLPGRRHANTTPSKQALAASLNRYQTRHAARCRSRLIIHDRSSWLHWHRFLKHKFLPELRDLGMFHYHCWIKALRRLPRPSKNFPIRISSWMMFQINGDDPCKSNAM